MGKGSEAGEVKCDGRGSGECGVKEGIVELEGSRVREGIVELAG